MIKDFIDDARYALRQLRASPGFALTCLLSLALGIAATTSVYSVIRGVLLHPYPYRGADRMVSFRITTDVGYNGFSNYLLLNRKELEMIQRSDVLDGVIASDSWDMAATGQELPEAVHTGKLSANALEYFGVPPLVGRVFTEADESQRVNELTHLARIRAVCSTRCSCIMAGTPVFIGVRGLIVGIHTPCAETLFC